MRFKITNVGLRIFICYLLLFLFLMVGVTQGSDANKEMQQKDLMMKSAIKTMNDLKMAIKTRDFSKLRYDVPEEKPLSWRSCGWNSHVDLSFDEMVKKLFAIAKNRNITVNETPLEIFYVTIETKDWNSEYPYLYFEFKRVSYGWRWLGVYGCSSRSSDFLSARKGQFADLRRDVELKRLVNHLKQTIVKKDFKMLKPYVPDKYYYTWRAGCEDSDVVSDELTFEAITGILLQHSKGVEIHFNPKPDIYWESKRMAIETDGWLGEDPFITFLFDFINDRWVWDGACYSTRPTFKLTDH